MITKKVLLCLPKHKIDKPVIYEIIKHYDVIINIFRAKITPDEEGFLVLDLTGTEVNIENSLNYLTDLGIRIDATNKGMIWNENRCTHCGICIPNCPTKALDITNAFSREISFNADLCIECLHCLSACPYGVCSSIFSK